ncbi:c-type cytochrome [Xanthobacter sp. TB0136]|uniref:c-type cytochrome n=1 Tax=Xanthobacter sp. TB0136 TaxID=3459177 RepID=UPI0040392F5B
MRLKVTAALFAGLAVATAGLSVAHADNVIQQRQARMKEMGAQMKVGADMAKGTIAFDSAKAAEIFKTLQTSMDGYVSLFPPGSDKGETKALAVVWSDRAGFESAIASFNKSVDEGVAKGAADEAAFKTAFAAAAEGCRSCHQTFKAR